MLPSQAMQAEVMFFASSVHGGLHCHSSSHKQRIRGSKTASLLQMSP